MGERLYDAAKWGHTQKVAAILTSNPRPNVNCRSGNGKTPLFISASWGFWDTVRVLLENGAAIDECVLNIACYTAPRYRSQGSDKYYNNYTIASKHQGYRMATFFTSQVLHVEEFGQVLYTLRHDHDTLVGFRPDREQDIPDEIMAIVVYYNHFATILELLKYSAIRNGWTGMEFSRRLCMYNAKLLTHRWDFEIERNGRKLYNAAAYGDVKQVRQILENAPNININWRNDKGNTPLYIAAAWGMQNQKIFLPSERIEVKASYFETVVLLISRGANVNAVNNKKRSVLYIAASWGHWNIVKYLLEHGAVVNENVMDIAVSTAPRDNKTLANNIPSQHHRYETAKTCMRILMESGRFADILFALVEDYDTLNRATIRRERNIPDDIMKIVVYYNHFATIVELLQATIKNEAELVQAVYRYNNTLLQHRYDLKYEVKNEDCVYEVLVNI